MSSFFSLFLKAGLPFGLMMTIFFSLIYGWQNGLISGLASGFLFGLILAVFAVYQSSKFTKNRPLLPNEKLIKEGPANHFLNAEGIGGWVYLTDRRFYFKSHKGNIQNHELTIPLQEIVDAEKTNTFGIIPNRLSLNLRNGKTEKFLVKGAKEWVNVLKTLISG